jgi:hypothetical protein
MVVHPPSVENWDSDVLKAAREIDNMFFRPDWTSTYPGHGENSAKGEYAIDFMCNREFGDKIAKYAWDHRKRLGIRYIVWWGRIISETNPTKPNVWLPYRHRNAVKSDGSPDASKRHTNHVHVSFYPNAVYRALVVPLAFVLARFKGAVKLARYNLGDRSHVRVVQTALRQLGYKEIQVNGYRDHETRTALRKFLSKWGWKDLPNDFGRRLTYRQMDRVIWEAEKLEAGTQYPPRKEK